MKGVSEDVPATLFVVILLVVFLLSVLHTHGNYFGSVNFIQQKRIASSVAEDISLLTSAVENPDDFVKQFDKTGVIVEIINEGTGRISKSSQKTFTRTAAVSSAALLIKEGNIFYPARVDVYVGE